MLPRLCHLLEKFRLPSRSTQKASPKATVAPPRFARRRKSFLISSREIVLQDHGSWWILIRPHLHPATRSMRRDHRAPPPHHQLRPPHPVASITFGLSYLTRQLDTANLYPTGKLLWSNQVMEFRCRIQATLNIAYSIMALERLELQLIMRPLAIGL